MSERDSQRSRVYKAEKEIPHGRVFNSVKEIQDFCDRMTSSKWWQATYPNILKINVGDGRRRSSASGVRSGNTIKIAMPKFSRNELIVIHEVVHGLKKAGEAWHGKEYCGEYLKVVRHFMGVASSKALLDAFDRNGVIYTEPITPIPPSKYKGLVRLVWITLEKSNANYTHEYRKRAMLGEHPIGSVMKDPKYTANKFRAYCFLIDKLRGKLGDFDIEEDAINAVEETVNLWVFKAGLKPVK